MCVPSLRGGVKRRRGNLPIGDGLPRPLHFVHGPRNDGENKNGRNELFIFLFTVNANRTLSFGQWLAISLSFAIIWSTEIFLLLQSRMRKLLFIGLGSISIGFLSFVEARAWDLP